MAVIETNNVFAINDLFFTVGASAIDVQQENLSYKFYTLRENTSTKLPSGHGSTLVSVSIAIPKEDILKLHRLTVQVRRNPIVYIENKFIRQKIVPHWSTTQNMAFTVLAFSIESVIGNTGLFNLSLQLQWFNYFPFTHNFLFREEWETDWRKLPSNEYLLDATDFTDSLIYADRKDVQYIKNSLYGYITRYSPTVSSPVNGFKKTFEDNFEDFDGFIYDLLPLPSGMTKALPVQSPRDSFIYKRFYNRLQADALKDNFGIEIEQEIGYKQFYLDLLSGNNILPDYLDKLNKSINIIENMMGYDGFRLAFKVYKYVDLPLTLRNAFLKNLNGYIDDFTSSTVSLEEKFETSDAIPESLKTNLAASSWQNLLKCNPVFRDIAIQVIEKMINGDNLSGIRYIAGSDFQLLINDATYRDPKTDTINSTSLHRITTPDGIPDSFALDLNLADTGGVGNFLDFPGIEEKLNVTSQKYRNKAIYVLLFHMDYGYIVNKYFSNTLLWGGSFDHADQNSNQNAIERIGNSNIILSYAKGELEKYRDLSGKGPLPSNWFTSVWPKGTIGIDPVHIQYKIAGSTTSVYNKLQSGWRPATLNGSAIYNQDYGSYTNAAGKIKPWYEFTEALKDSEFTKDDIQFFELILELKRTGWNYYSKDPSVNGVFEKTIEVRVDSTGGIHHLLNDIGFHGTTDGSYDDLDTVLHKVAGTIKHITASIPIVGQEFPTQQHLGSIEPVYNLEFLTADRTGLRDGVGQRVQLIESARLTLQQNARNLKTIYDSWMACPDTFITRLFGTTRADDLVTKTITKKHKKVVINSSNITTIPNQPGLASYSLQLEESQPFVDESLTKITTATKVDYNKIYKKIISKILEVSDKTAYSPGNQIIQNSLNKFYEDAKKYGGFSVESLPFNIFNNQVSSNVEERADASFSVGFDYLKLKESVTTNLTQEESLRLGYLVQLVGLQKVLAELILFENQYGGIEKQDLYGLESIIKPVAGKFLDYQAHKFGPLSIGVLKILGNSSTVLAGALSGVALLEGTAATLGYQIGSVPADLTGIESAADAGAAVWAIAALPLVVPAAILGGIFGFGVANTDEQEYVIDEGIKSIIIAAYLKELFIATNNPEIAFTSLTSDMAGSLISSFFDFDKSPIQSEEFYGLANAVRSYLKYVYDGEASVGKPLGNINNTSITLTNEFFEKNKYQLVKTTLESLLRSIFTDSFLVEFFDIKSEVSNLYRLVNIDQKDTLPDLYLPEHPYWNKTYLTPPDFYYYNFHEDGQYSNLDYLKRLYSSHISNNVSATKDFLESLKEGENPNTFKDDISLGETRGVFDGDDNASSSDFRELARENDMNRSISPNGFTSINPETDPDTLTFNITSGEDGEDREITNSVNWLASNFDRDSIYTPMSTDLLIESIKNKEASFGVKDGYANERNEIQKLIPGKAFALSDENQLPDAMTHYYGKEDLKNIAMESLKDMVGQKFTMKRVWPTYRLYFIEEDQNEDFLTNYDDFYHYNAITEITIVRSREIASDVAIIRMQNISGLLDGSKRLIIKDTDYLYDNRNPDGTFTSKGTTIEKGRSSLAKDTIEEEPIGSIVLRPGVNMQLRMGYGNDANNLEVKLSGRVIDIVFSENSDVVEITIQSFAVELEQQQKGLDPDSIERYDLTHKLLGALMFSPELKHFGRFERGTALQYGENKDSRIDFKSYDTNSWWSKLTGVYYRNTATAIKEFWNADNASMLGFGLATATGTIAPYMLYNFASNVKPISNIYTSFLSDHFYHLLTQIKQNTTLLSNSIEERFYYMLWSPQDDNIFAPNPKDYLLRPGWAWAITKEGLIAPILRNRSFSGIGKKFARLAMRATTNQKLSIEDLSYSISNSTIFQIFHEMTLRHPGYVYGAMPYGKEFRYTMFYGVGSQRYWSKPAHPLFIERINKTRQAISSPLQDDLVHDHKKAGIRRTFFKSKTIDEFSSNLKEFMMSEEDYTLLRSKEITDQAINIKGDTKVFQKLGIASLQDALYQYYQALTLRFEPFRRYHMATSETDIISNNICLSEYNFANAIACKYYYNDEKNNEQEDITLVKLHDNIPDEDIRLKQIDYKNVHSELMALRYGTGELIYQAKQMYSGNLLLLGNSRIKPWDYIYIIDKYNDISGVIEVEQVVEKLSYEFGYICDIKPNAVVFANETSSMPIIEGVKTIAGALTVEQSRFYSSFTGNDFFNILTSNSITESAVDTLNYIYDGKFTNGDAQSISSYAQYQINEITKIPVSNNLSLPQNAFMSGAWLLGGLFYLNKVSAGQSVIVYPLFKNGIPYVAGIPKGSPETIWTIFRGQVSAFVNDITKGTSDYLSYWKLLGVESLKAFSSNPDQLKRISEAGDR